MAGSKKNFDMLTPDAGDKVQGDEQLVDLDARAKSDQKKDAVPDVTKDTSDAAKKATVPDDDQTKEKKDSKVATPAVSSGTTTPSLTPTPLIPSVSGGTPVIAPPPPPSTGKNVPHVKKKASGATPPAKAAKVARKLGFLDALDVVAKEVGKKEAPKDIAPKIEDRRNFSSPVFFAYEGKGLDHFFGHVAMAISYDKGEPPERHMAYLTYGMGANSPLIERTNPKEIAEVMNEESETYGKPRRIILPRIKKEELETFQKALADFKEFKKSEYSWYKNNCVNRLSCFMLDTKINISKSFKWWWFAMPSQLLSQVEGLKTDEKYYDPVDTAIQTLEEKIHLLNASPLGTRDLFLHPEKQSGSRPEKKVNSDTAHLHLYWKNDNLVYYIQEKKDQKEYIIDAKTLNLDNLSKEHKKGLIDEDTLDEKEKDVYKAILRKVSEQKHTYPTESPSQLKNIELQRAYRRLGNIADLLYEKLRLEQFNILLPNIERELKSYQQDILRNLKWELQRQDSLENLQNKVTQSLQLLGNDIIAGPLQNTLAKMVSILSPPSEKDEKKDQKDLHDNKHDNNVKLAALSITSHSTSSRKKESPPSSKLQYTLDFQQLKKSPNDAIKSKGLLYTKAEGGDILRDVKRNVHINNRSIHKELDNKSEEEQMTHLKNVLTTELKATPEETEAIIYHFSQNPSYLAFHCLFAANQSNSLGISNPREPITPRIQISNFYRNENDQICFKAISNDYQVNRKEGLEFKDYKILTATVELIFTLEVVDRKATEVKDKYRYKFNSLRTDSPFVCNSVLSNQVPPALLNIYTGQPFRTFDDPKKSEEYKAQTKIDLSSLTFNENPYIRALASQLEDTGSLYWLDIKHEDFFNHFKVRFRDSSQLENINLSELTAFLLEESKRNTIDLKINHADVDLELKASESVEDRAKKAAFIILGILQASVTANRLDNLASIQRIYNRDILSFRDFTPADFASKKWDAQTKEDTISSLKSQTLHPAIHAIARELKTAGNLYWLNVQEKHEFQLLSNLENLLDKNYTIPELSSFLLEAQRKGLISLSPLLEDKDLALTKNDNDESRANKAAFIIQGALRTQNLTPSLQYLDCHQKRVTTENQFHHAIEKHDTKSVKDTKTNFNKLKRMKLLSVGNPALEAIVTQLEGGTLYWLTIKKSLHFISLLENCLDNHLTPEKLAKLLLEAKNNGIIQFNQDIHNTNLKLDSNDTDEKRAQLASKLIISVLHKNELLEKSPQTRFIEQISLIPPEMPARVMHSYQEFLKKPEDFRDNFFKFYFDVYLEERNFASSRSFRERLSLTEEERKHSPYLLRLRNLANANPDLTHFPESKDPENLHKNILMRTALDPSMRRYIMSQCLDAIKHRDKKRFVNALKIIQAMGKTAIREWNLTEVARIKTTRTFLAHLREDQTENDLINDYENYCKMIVRDMPENERTLLNTLATQGVKIGNIETKNNPQALEALTQEFEKTHPSVPNLSFVRRAEKMSAREIKNALQKMDATPDAKELDSQAKRIFTQVQLQLPRYYKERPDELKTALENLADAQLQAPADHTPSNTIRLKTQPEVKAKDDKHVAGATVTPSTEEKHATIGDTLLKQIKSGDTNLQKNGLNSVFALAQQLPFSKQKNFLAAVAPAEFAKLAAAHQKTIENISRIDYIQQLFEEERRQLYEDIKDLKQQLSQPRLSIEEKTRIESSLETLADQLKKLGKKAQKRIKKFTDKQANKALQKALNELYQSITPTAKSPEEWEILLRNLFTAPNSNFFNAPLIRAERNFPSKLDLRDLFQNSPGANLMENALFVAPKSGGANDPGEFGGRYVVAYTGPDNIIRFQTVFYKQATDNAQPAFGENIAEPMAARMMGDIIGDNTASAFHALRPYGNMGNPNDVYVASIVFDKYADVHELAHRAALGPDAKIPARGKGKYGGQWINASRSKARPKAARGNPQFGEGLLKLATEGRDPNHPSILPLRDLGKSLMASLLVGNYQIHTENVGVANLSGRDQFAILDFGGAFRRRFEKSSLASGYNNKQVEHGRFERNVNPDNESGNGLKRHACYFLGYPESIRLSKEFIDGIDIVANANRQTLEKSVDDSIKHAVTFNGIDGFKKYFAKELNTDIRFQESLKNNPVETVKTLLNETLMARQLSIREFSLESKFRHILKEQSKERPPSFDLATLAKDNPIYTVYILNKNGLNSLKPDEKNRLLKQLEKLHEPINSAQLPDPYRSAPENEFVTNLFNIPPNKPQELLKYLHEFTTNHGEYKFSEPLVKYLETAKNNNYDESEIGIVIQACDEVYRAVREPRLKAALKRKRNESLPLAAVPGEPDNKHIATGQTEAKISSTVVTLKENLLFNLSKGGTDGQNAVATLFEIANALSPVAQDNFIDKLVSEFDINRETDDTWVIAYQNLNAAKNSNNETNITTAMLNIIDKLQEASYAYLNPTEIEKWERILAVIDANSPILNSKLNPITGSIEAELNKLNKPPFTFNDRKTYYVADLNSTRTHIAPYSGLDGKIHILHTEFSPAKADGSHYASTLSSALKRSLVSAFAKKSILVQEDRSLYLAQVSSSPSEKVTLSDLKSDANFRKGMIASWWSSDSDPRLSDFSYEKNLGMDTKTLMVASRDEAIPLGLTPDVRPKKWNNLSKEIPELVFSKEMADSIDDFFSSPAFFMRITDSIKEEIEAQTKLADRTNDTQAFRAYAERIMGPAFTIQYKDYIHDIKIALQEFVPQVMKDRAQSMLELGLKMRVELAWDEKNSKPRIDMVPSLSDLVKQHPNYFLTFKSKDGLHATENKALDNFIAKQINETIQSENQAGLEKFLANDFKYVTDIKERARVYIARLKIFSALDSDFKNDELIASIESAQKRNRIPQLMQLCDQAYAFMLDRFAVMNFEKKLKVYEVFSKATSPDSHILTLEGWAESQAEPLEKFSMENNQFLRDLDRSLAHQQAMTLNAKRQPGEFKNRAEVVKNFEETTKFLSEKFARKATPDSTLHKVQARVEKIKQVLKLPEDKKDSSPPQHFYPSAGTLKPLKLDLTGSNTLSEALQKSSFKNLISSSDLTKKPASSGIAATVSTTEIPLDLETPEIKLDATTAMICPNPVDTHPIANNPVSGCVVTKAENHMRIQEVKEADRLSLAHLIAEQLAKNSAVKLNPDLTEDAKVAGLQKLVQQFLIDKLQNASPPRMVTPQNIREFLEERNIKLELGIFKPTYKSISNEVFSAITNRMQCSAYPELPHEDYLTWAYFWIKTLKSDPNTNMRNFYIENSQGNPKLVEAILIIAKYEGADPVKANRTGYKIEITQAQVEAYKKILSTPDNPVYKSIMSRVHSVETDELAAERSMAHTRSLLK